MNIPDFNQMVIPYYSPISAKGGKRRKNSGRTRKHKRSNKSRTIRRYY